MGPTLECRGAGPSECRTIGVPNHRSAGPSGCRTIGVPDYGLSPGGQEIFFIQTVVASYFRLTLATTPVS
ncbi:MAG: hypothetical protein WBG62_19905, partial [Cyclobacteriaceae bacterium]